MKVKITAIGKGGTHAYLPATLGYKAGDELDIQPKEGTDAARKAAYGQIELDEKAMRRIAREEIESYMTNKRGF